LGPRLANGPGSDPVVAPGLAKILRVLRERDSSFGRRKRQDATLSVQHRRDAAPDRETRPTVADPGEFSFSLPSIIAFGVGAE